MNHEFCPRNINELWATIIVQEFLRWGVTHWFVSPGYRGAPLVAVIAAYHQITTISCPDERAAAFQALGYSRLTGFPSGLLCTSGTAGANYYPAVIEASRDQVPLVVLTADRPMKAIRTGANQVMVQSRLFGGFVKDELSLPDPGCAFDAAALAAHVGALVQASRQFPRGPVHLNMPLQEPLEPVEDAKRTILNCERDEARSVTDLRRIGPMAIASEPPVLSAGAADLVRKALSDSDRPLLVVGRLPPDQDTDLVAEMVARSGLPTILDISSGCRQGDAANPWLSPALPGAAAILREYAPDLVLHLGKTLVAKQLDQYLGKEFAGTYIIAGQDTGPFDSLLRCDLKLVCGEATIGRLLAEFRPKGSADSFVLAASRMLSLKRELLNAIADSPFGFPGLAVAIWQNTRSGRNLFLGNSMTVRAFDCFAFGASEVRRVIMQRGVSGIEGHIANGLGIAATGDPVTVVCGDIAVMHDLNSMIPLSQSKRDLIVVVANNHGGGIFRHLPIGRYPEVHEPLITTPHQLNFEGLCRWLGIEYAAVNTTRSFTEVYSAFQEKGGVAVIECNFDDNIEADLMGRLNAIKGA